ncbi:hypothetical protein F5Y19DRAFT_478659 [Xylariaceae sp. FL1651]|nr:hypothetical protein F5Y19DRAFT_478659 [Xylariaceae sp. FL1651]
MKAFFLLPASLAGLVLAHAASPSVYILMPSNPALTAVSSALDTLGYRHSEFTATIASAELGLDPSTYAVLAPGTAYKNISRANPDAKFILPVTANTADSSYWLGAFVPAQTGRGMQADDYADSVRAFFADSDENRYGRSQLLELDASAPASHAQAQAWVALCDFLGLGYSVVERLKLWRFPQ